MTLQDVTRQYIDLIIRADGLIRAPDLGSPEYRTSLIALVNDAYRLGCENPDTALTSAASEAFLRYREGGIESVKRMPLLDR